MTAKLAEALVAAQKEMPAVRPNARAEVPTKSGGKYTYEYVTLDHLIALTRPVLNEHGLAIAQHVEVLDTGQPVLRTTLLHISGERFDAGTLPLFSEKAMQPLGGSVTYARRYAWAAVLGISGDEDNDAGNQASAATPSGGASTGGGRGAAPAAPSVYTDEDVNKLVALAEERGGDPAKVRTAAETARAQGKLDTWLPDANKFWQSKPVASSYEKKAADAIKSAGEKQAVRAAAAQADRDAAKPEKAA